MGHQLGQIPHRECEGWAVALSKILSAWLVASRRMTMSTFSYTAVDLRGVESRGSLDVCNQAEALQRIKEMGLFPVRVSPKGARRPAALSPRAVPKWGMRRRLRWIRWRVKSRSLSAFTRQLATLIDAGMPLLRGLRLLAEQEESRLFRRIINEVAASIEAGSSLADALSAHQNAFDKLYVNMVKAGEMSGSLEMALARLAEFKEKAQRIKSKVRAALVYPCAVLCVAVGVMTLLLVYIVPRFQAILDGLNGSGQLPAFTRFVFRLSEQVRDHFALGMVVLSAAGGLFYLFRRTAIGRETIDRMKLWWPVVGMVFRKASIARFSRTLGTLAANGVPILQALTLVEETAGNVVVGRVIRKVHDNVKQGDPIAPTLKAAGIFPVMVSGMVDVGEQTGALPELLLKVADNYDEEVDTAVGALTSLLEPLLIVVLALIVGSIVIAIFLPLVSFNPTPGSSD